MNDLLQYLPPKLRSRYTSLRSYASTALFPEPEWSKQVQKAKGVDRKELFDYRRQHSDAASLLLFAFLLKQMFMQHYEAITKTVDTLKEIGVDSFRIGSVLYKERNENVVIGLSLLESLTTSITDPALREVLLEARKMHEILDYYSANCMKD